MIRSRTTSIYCVVDALIKEAVKDLVEDPGSCADASSYFGAWSRTAAAVFVREGTSEMVRLVTTQYGGSLIGTFDKPVIVMNSSGAVMELPFHVASTCDCNGSTYYTWRRNTRQWQELDWSGWQKNFNRRLPRGLENQNGFWPDLKSMTTTGGLWRKEDPHCCPSGGTVDVQLGITGSRFSLKSLKLHLTQALKQN
jgi:hypothetical protein